MTAESTEKKKKDTDVNGTTTETDAVLGAKGEDAKGEDAKSEDAKGEDVKGEDAEKTDGLGGDSIGPTRDGKSLPVKRPSNWGKESRAWEGPTPVRRNRHDRPKPEWAHDSESEAEEDGCQVLTTADTKSAGEGTKEVVLGAKGEVENKEPATPGEQAVAEKTTGEEEAAGDPSVFVDVPLSTPTHCSDDEVAKGFMAAEEITAHDDGAALFAAPLVGEITAHADDCAAALTFAPHVTDEQRPRTSQLLAAQLLEPRAITTAGAITTAAPSAVTDEKELSFSRTPFSKRPIGKTDNVEESVQKKQTLHVVATMHPGSPGADHPPPAL